MANKNLIMVRVDDSVLKKINALIEKHKFDSKSSVVRKAIYEFLERQEKVIIS